MAPLDLSLFAQPESNEPDTVQSALDALAGAHDETSADDACDAYLWSVGNNQSGTFYPVVLGTLPVLAQLLSNGSGWTQRAVMEALIDLGGTFVPQAGHETCFGDSVQDMLKAFIGTLRHQVAPWAAGGDQRARSAADLVDLIDDLTELH